MTLLLLGCPCSCLAWETKTFRLVFLEPIGSRVADRFRRVVSMGDGGGIGVITCVGAQWDGSVTGLILGAAAVVAQGDRSAGLALVAWVVDEIRVLLLPRVRGVLGCSVLIHGCVWFLRNATD
jgi:hypothetical protein